MSIATQEPAVDRLDVGPRRRPPRPGRRTRVARAVLAWAGTSLVLLAASLATTRGWRPPTQVTPPVVEPLAAVAPGDRHLPYAFVDRSDLVLETGARARVVRPRGAEGTIPGVVLVAGAGATTRDDLAAEAEALARGGLAVLSYDKRAAGYSPVSRDYPRLAADALDALDVLAQEPGVDPGRVGLLGYSEGGWVVPIAAQLAPHRVALAGHPRPARVAFTVLVSAPVVSPLEQAGWLADQAFAPAPTVVRSSVATVLAMGRPLIGYLVTDVRPALAAGRAPVYAVWGAADRVVPVAVAVRRLQAVAGARSSIEVVPGAGHRVGVATGWAERVSDWVRRGYPLDDVVRGGPPDSLVGLPTLPAPGPLSDPRLHRGLAAAAALVGACWPVRRRTRRARVRTARSG